MISLFFGNPTALEGTNLLIILYELTGIPDVTNKIAQSFSYAGGLLQASQIGDSAVHEFLKKSENFIQSIDEKIRDALTIASNFIKRHTKNIIERLKKYWAEKFADEFEEADDALVWDAQ